MSDILGELQRQIGSLDRQARRAARFKKLRSQLRDLELVVASESFAADAAALREAERALEATRGESVALEARVAARDADLETSRRTHVEREKELGLLSEQLYALRTAIQALESRSAYERRERTGLLELASEREGEIAQLDEQLVSHTTELAEVVRELGVVEARIAADQSELARREIELREHGDGLAAVQGRREALQARLVELSSEEAALRGRREALVERQRDLELRLRYRDDALEANALQLESLRRDEEGAGDRLRRALAEQDELQLLLAEQLRHQTEARAQSESLAAERDALQARLSQASARLESLREIERREALRAAALLERLPEASRSTIQGLLPEVLEVDDGLESAVEAALAGRLEAVLVNGAEAALHLIAHLRETGAGRATVLPLAKNERDPEPGFVPLGRPLANFVRVRGARGALVERLLRDVYLVDDLAAPIERFGVASPPAVFVTRAGELLDRSGVVTGGLSAPPGALSRAGDIRRLEAEVAELEERVRGVLRRTAEAAARQTALGGELENTRNRRHTAELAVVNLEKDLERMRERGKEAADAAQVQREDREALQGQLDRGAEEGSALAPRLEEIARERVRAADLREQLGAEIARRTRELEAVEQRLVQARIQLAELGAKRDQSGESRARLESSVADGRDWIARRREEVAGARERAAELERSADAAGRELALRIADEDQLRARQTALRESFEASAGEVEAAEQALRTAAREREALRDRLAQVELDAHDARSKCEQVSERIRERYDVDISAYQAPPEALQGDPETRARELEEVREALRTLGDVNLGSIEEYEEVSERFRYMSEQKTDLEQAIERLRSAIARINRTSRDRFRETFEAIRKEFDVIFPMLFQGGRADLRLIRRGSRRAGVRARHHRAAARQEAPERDAACRGARRRSRRWRSSSPSSASGRRPSACSTRSTRRSTRPTCCASASCSKMSHNTQFVLITHNSRRWRSPTCSTASPWRSPGCRSSSRSTSSATNCRSGVGTAPCRLRAT